MNCEYKILLENIYKYFKSEILYVDESNYKYNKPKCIQCYPKYFLYTKIYVNFF